MGCGVVRWADGITPRLLSGSSEMDEDISSHIKKDNRPGGTAKPG